MITKSKDKDKSFMQRLANSRLAKFLLVETTLAFSLTFSVPMIIEAKMPNTQTQTISKKELNGLKAKAEVKGIKLAQLDIRDKLNQEQIKALRQRIKKELSKDNSYPDGKAVYDAVEKVREEIIRVLEVQGKKPTEENIMREAKRIYESFYVRGVNDSKELLLNNASYNIYSDRMVKDIVYAVIKSTPYIILAFPTKEALSKAAQEYGNIAESAEETMDGIIGNAYECDMDCFTSYAVAVSKNLFYDLMSDILRDAAPHLLGAYQDMVKAEQAGREAEQLGREAEEARRRAKKWEELEEKIKNDDISF